MRFLTILEVSQKQAYIFASNHLQDNIVNSAVIAWIMSSEYFEQAIQDKGLYSEKNNLVYSGGGHTVLEFPNRGSADLFAKKVTKKIREEYEGIEVFVKTIEYDETETPGKNLKKLTEELERKKSKRASAFHQGSFGVERIDTATLKPVLADDGTETGKKKMPESESKLDQDLCPEGFRNVWKFKQLGGSKHESNFIAVVHIDGNAMGKRVEQFQEQHGGDDWDSYKRNMRNFSDAIDKDFKCAYRRMARTVAENIKKGNLKELSLGEHDFPVRRIITAGDDICFVTEGRIGIECAALFLKELASIGKEKNNGELYAACAGVALVHQKYPFYKAYELAEMLCDNAKKFGASFSADKSGKDISVIDWHIEFGEMKDTLKEIRERYRTQDGNRLELRPYIVDAEEEILKKEPIRRYENFRKLTVKILKEDIAYARSRLKELRNMLKQGETAAEYYMEFHKINDIALESYQDVFRRIDVGKIGTGEKLERKIFVETDLSLETGEKRSILFDSIEVLDTFLALDEGEGLS